MGRAVLDLEMPMPKRNLSSLILMSVSLGAAAAVVPSCSQATCVDYHDPSCWTPADAGDAATDDVDAAGPEAGDAIPGETDAGEAGGTGADGGNADTGPGDAPAPEAGEPGQPDGAPADAGDADKG